MVALLAASPAIGEVVALEASDLLDADLKPLLEGASRLVHLSFATPDALDEDAFARENAEATRRLLDAAGAVGLDHVTVVTSATVYGAWPTNPVPLTEEAPVRPNPGFGYAAQKAEIERLCGAWVAAHPGTSLAVLRPARALGDDHESWLSRSLRAASAIGAGGADPQVQFVAVDDLAAAVAEASIARLDGAYNVAADGWLTGEEVRALAGSPLRLPVPERLATAFARWGWRWRLHRAPPGLIPYTMHPFVVANDRLRATGWVPTTTNEEAYVAAHEGTPWSRLSPKRRQELALGASAAALAALVAGTVTLIRRLKSAR